MVKYLVAFSILLWGSTSKAQSTTGVMQSVLAFAGESVYFWGYDSSKKIKLFTIDPGSDSARQVMNLVPGGNDARFVRSLKVAGNKVYFIAKDGNGFEKIYMTTAGATTVPTKVSDTAGTVSDDSVQFATETSTEIFFTAVNTDGVTRLYSINKTTDAVTQVSLGCVDGSSVPCDDNPSPVIAQGDNVYFAAYDGLGNFMLYLKKPNVATVALDGPSGVLDYFDYITVVGNRVFFSAYYAVNGGTLLKLFSHDGSGSTVTEVSDTSSGGNDDPTQLKAIENDLYFSANDSSGYSRLYKVANGVGAPVLQTTINAGASDAPSGYFRVGTDLYFTAYTAGVSKLFKLTSTGVRTQVTNTSGNGVSDDAQISFVHEGKIFLNALLSSSSKGFVYDTSTGSLTKIVDRGNQLSSFIQSPIYVGDKVYFADALSRRTANHFYSYDTSSSELETLTQYSGTVAQVSPMFKVNSGKLVYSGGTKNYSDDLGGGSIGMWSESDLGAMVNGYSSQESAAIPSDKGIYVSADPASTGWASKLMFFDFTSNSLQQISDLAGYGVSDGTDSEIYALGSGRAYFAVNNGSERDYYYTNGSSFTHLDVAAGVDDGITNARLVGNSLYFEAHDISGTYFLQASHAGAMPITFTGTSGYAPGNVYSVSSSKVFFVGVDGSSNTKVFSANLDGTGVTQIADLNVGNNDSVIAMASSGLDLYFVENGSSTNVLYHYDGSSGITTALDSTGEVVNDGLKIIDDYLYFNTYNANFKLEKILMSTGARSVVSGDSSVSIVDLLKINQNLFYISADPGSVRKLHQVNAAGIASVFPMPDSDMSTINTEMRSDGNYLYFSARSSSGFSEYFRFSVP